MSSIEAPARITRCPTCGKSSRYDLTNPDRPFCSARCKTQDIAAWADESFRIPVLASEESDEQAVPQESEETEADEN